MDAPTGAIVRLRRDGYSYRRIAAYLDRKQLRPPRARSWSAASVRNIWIRATENEEAAPWRRPPT